MGGLPLAKGKDDKNVPPNHCFLYKYFKYKKNGEKKRNKNIYLYKYLVTFENLKEKKKYVIKPLKILEKRASLSFSSVWDFCNFFGSKPNLRVFEEKNHSWCQYAIFASR